MFKHKPEWKSKTSIEKTKKRWSNNAKKKRQELRKICLIHYGGNPPKCACCGEMTYKFLAIDHINGNGNKHRKNLSANGSIHYSDFCRWLIKNNFPDGFQILCHNCNCAKGYYGICPHKE